MSDVSSADVEPVGFGIRTGIAISAGERHTDAFAPVHGAATERSICQQHPVRLNDRTVVPQYFFNSVDDQLRLGTQRRKLLRMLEQCFDTVRDEIARRNVARDQYQIALREDLRVAQALVVFTG